MAANGVIQLTTQCNVSTIQNSTNTSASCATLIALALGGTNSVYLNSFLSTKILIANAVATHSVQLLSMQGVVLGTVTGVTAQVLGTVLPNVGYVLRFTAGAAVLANAVLYQIQVAQDIVNSTYFANGFEPQITPSSSLSYSVNSYGAITFTFVNYPLTINQIIPLALANNALQSGTLVETSSDLTVAASLNFPFVAGSFLGLSIVSLKTTIFTGTISYNVSTAGTSAVLPIAPIAL